jgi:hypothetical protein
MATLLEIIVGLALLFGIGAPLAAAADAVGYDAAIFAPGPTGRSQQLLRLFPSGFSREVDISLPFPVHVLAISPDGATLYAQAVSVDVFQPPKGGLLTIGFNPTTVKTIPGSSGFVATSSLAAWPHEDKLLISGPYVVGNKAVCGVYEFVVPTGTVRKLLDAANCDLPEAWTYLSVSPDGLHAVAIHRRQLELIDLLKGTARSLGDGFHMAAWSPDGKWISVREYTKEDNTVLFDAVTFARARTLDTAEMLWSPDSRYLLSWKALMQCGPDVESLERLDVMTGKSSVIESSLCKAWGGSGGWVSSRIRK